MSSAEPPDGASDETGEKLVEPDAHPTDVEEPAGAESGDPAVAETAETGELSDAEDADAGVPPAAAEAEAAPPAADEESEEEADELREGLVATLRERLGDDLLEHHIRPRDDVWIRVERSAWRRAGEVCRDVLACDYFCFLSAIDWMPSPYGRYEDAEVDRLMGVEAPAVEGSEEAPKEMTSGYAGGGSRFQLLARLHSTTRKYGITLKADLEDERPRVESWIPVYAGADWHEREAWEMYGIEFEGHPELKHIYLPGGFEGHPLRKDFPLLAREVKPWPGIVDVEPMPGEADGDSEAEGAETEGADA